MSEKEQAEVLKLLAEMVRAFKPHTLSLAEVQLIRRAEAFLELPEVVTDVTVEPESHGRRRR